MSDTKTKLPDFSDIEKEICLLLSCRKSIKSMVNRAMLCIGESPDGFTIRPNDSHNAELFNILLVDFISPVNPSFGKADSIHAALSRICDAPNFDHNNSISELKEAVIAFSEWLNYEAKFEKIWLPSIEKEMSITMRREEFIRICGNISKHSPLRLSKISKRIFDILQKDEPALDIEDAFSVIEEFYEWFHRDVFYYHLTKISELLNNIGWGIQTYLASEYSQSYTIDQEKTKKYGMGSDIYYFEYPSAVKNKLGKYYYWDLMNEIRVGMYIKKFSTNKSLEGLY